MWNERESPLRIEKRFEFDQYSKISKFMGELRNYVKKGISIQISASVRIL